MSSEIHKYPDANFETKKNLFKAEVINFPNNKIKDSLDLKKNNYDFWKLYDNSNTNEDGDQLKAVTGICFMLSVLFLIGLYSIVI